MRMAHTAIWAALLLTAITLVSGSPLYAQNWPAWSNPTLPKADASTGAVENLKFRLSEQYASLDGSHPDSDPIPNRHIVKLNWYRTELSGNYPLVPSWDVEASLPFDIKDVHARYELPNGDPYNNPEGNLHHRTETLTGISDPKIFVNFRPHALLFDTDSALIGGGFTLPLGRTEENPYKLAALGKRHEHMQFGDGTFDPLLRLGYFVMPDWWGVGVQGGMQAPLYENDKGYRGAFTADFAVGPLARFSQDLSMALRYHGLYQDRAKWDGEPDLNSGFFLQTVSLTVPVHFSQSLMLAPSAQYTISAKTLGDETFKLKLLFSLTLEYTFF